MSKYLLTILIVLAACCEASALIVVDGGKSDYDVVMRADAPKATKFAVSELLAYMKKTAGIEMAAVHGKAPGRKAIYVGAHPELPKTADFDQQSYSGQERFRIAELDGGDLSIMGADCDFDPVSRKNADFGLLFGVYEFIERFLGVRWYAPGDFGECYESLDKVEVTGLPVDQKPNYYERSYWPYIWNEFSRRDSLIFGRRMRAYGIRAGSSNHSMMDFYFPYHETMPEIFALMPDRKSRDFGAFRKGTKPEERQWAGYPQYCFTNPKFLEVYCKAIDDVYEKKPEGKFWKSMPPAQDTIHVTPDDNFVVNPCHCENCLKAIDRSKGRAAMSNLVWGFVKQVAEYAQTKYPGKTVRCIAYENYYDPPDFKLPDNVAVMISIEPYMLYFGNKAYRDSFEKTLSLWSEKISEITVWQYFLSYRDAMPYYLPNIANEWFRKYPNIKACFIELNDTGMTKGNIGRDVPINPEHGNEKTCTDLAQNHLTFVSSMKALWGSQVDVSAELERYYRLFYGPAAAPMKTYFDLAIKQWENVMPDKEFVEAGHRKFSGKMMYEDIYSAEVLDIMEKSLHEAKRLTSDDSIYRKRIQWLEDSYFTAFMRVARAYQKEATLSKDMVVVQSRLPAPDIDGELDDAFWKACPEQSLRQYNAPLPPRYATSFKIGFRDGMLYLGIRAEDSNIQTQRMNCESHDSAVYSDDSIELFFRTDELPPKAFRNVTINMLGTILDYDTLKGKMDRAYESGVDVKIIRGNDFFTMEMGIPLENLGIDRNAINPVLRMNVCRNKYSGVTQNRERTSWIPVYSSFWNVQDLPSIRLIGQNDPAIEDFSGPGKNAYPSFTQDDGKGGAKTVKAGCSTTMNQGTLEVTYTFPDIKEGKAYGNLLLTGLDNADLTKGRHIELRFKNPDPGLTQMACYSFEAKDGKTYSDWIRFSIAEKHEQFRLRSFDIAESGHHATKRKDKGIPHPEPVKLTYFAIYTHIKKQDANEHSFTLDYIRVTPDPIGN
jgi:hypothetical protein